MVRTRSLRSGGNPQSCIEKTVDKTGATVTRFFCPMCPSSVKHQRDLKRHIRQHTGEGELYCTEPGCTRKAGFLQKSNLEQHIRAKHLGIRLSCPHSWIDADGQVYECEQTFTNPSSLIQHRSVLHGFETGDDKAKVRKPTPVGMEFPDAKYRYLNRRKHAVASTNPMLPAGLHPPASLSSDPACALKTPIEAPVADSDHQDQLATAVQTPTVSAVPQTRGPDPKPQTAAATVNRSTFSSKITELKFTFPSLIPDPAGSSADHPDALVRHTPLVESAPEADVANSGLAPHASAGKRPGDEVGQLRSAVVEAREVSVIGSGAQVI